MIYFVLIVIACVLVWYIFRPGSSETRQCPVGTSSPSRQSSVGTNSNLRMFGCKDNGYSLSVWPKVSGIGRCVEFHIAGITFRGGAADRHLGEFVGRLVPEPNNPHDPNAIRIEAPDGTKVGYVPKERTYEVRGNATLPCSCCCFIARHGDHYITCCYIKV